MLPLTLKDIGYLGMTLPGLPCPLLPGRIHTTDTGGVCAAMPAMWGQRCAHVCL